MLASDVAGSQGAMKAANARSTAFCGATLLVAGANWVSALGTNDWNVPAWHPHPHTFSLFFMSHHVIPYIVGLECMSPARSWQVVWYANQPWPICMVNLAIFSGTKALAQWKLTKYWEATSLDELQLCWSTDIHTQYSLWLLAISHRSWVDEAPCGGHYNNSACRPTILHPL